MRVAGLLPILCSFVAIGLLGAAAEADLLGDVKSACAEKWPGNYRMQEYCIDTDLDAAIWLAETSEGLADDHVVVRIMLRCMDDWEDSAGRLNYRMVRYCTETQAESYRRLNPD